MINQRGARGWRWLTAFLLAALTLCIVAGCATKSPATAVKHGTSGDSPSTSSDGCPRTRLLPPNTRAAIDYVDFVRLYSVTYLNENATTRRYRAHPPLGNRVGVVRCNLEKLTNDGHRELVGRPTDGAAAVLPRGTALYSLLGYSPRCRLAAFWHGRRMDYLAQRERGDHSAPRGCALQ